MKDLIVSILNIFRYTGKVFSFIRNMILNTVFFLLLFIVFVSYFFSSSPEIADNSILKLTFSGDIVEERRTESPLESLLAETLEGDRRPEQTVLQDVLDLIDSAAYDPAITAILLEMKDLGAVGLNQMQTIGTALNAFRHQGKKVFAAEDFYTQKQYYLASYADSIILNPMGGVDLHGFGSYPLYFKDALDKLLVNYHVFRVGSYKSAIEPITRTSMSDEARAQNGEWLNVLWDTFTHDIATQRGLSTADISAYIDNIDTNLLATKGDTAQLALNTHLVDLLLTREELNAHLKSMTGNRDINTISTEDYLSQIEPSFTTSSGSGKDIGVIIAEGNIVGGNQPAGIIGSDSVVEQLRTARETASIKGVVLRINSGGGSAFASEIIRQEILELKKTGKPVVVSMGTLAASGGYWISADADEIWASPTTLTGSIGIFGAIPTFERSLARLGIYSDGVGTTGLAAGVNLAQPLNPQLKEAIQLTVNNGYDRFLDIVGKGRNIDKNALPMLAEGKVYSGKQAKELKLVDKLGSLDEAIDSAAELAGLNDFKAVYIERKSSMREQILQQLSSASSVLLADSSSTTVEKLYNQLRKQLSTYIFMDDPQNIYAHALLQLPL